MRIIIGYDGSQCADSAIDELPRAGLGADSQFLIVCASDAYPQLPATSYASIEPDNPSHILHRAHELAAECATQAASVVAGAKTRIERIFPSATIDTRGCAESPASGLLRAAEEWRADLIIVGSHGRSAFGRLLLGSVSQAIVN